VFVFPVVIQLFSSIFVVSHVMSLGLVGDPLKVDSKAESKSIKVERTRCTGKPCSITYCGALVDDYGHLYGHSSVNVLLHFEAALTMGESHPLECALVACDLLPSKFSQIINAWVKFGSIRAVTPEQLLAVVSKIKSWRDNDVVSLLVPLLTRKIHHGLLSSMLRMDVTDSDAQLLSTNAESMSVEMVLSCLGSINARTDSMIFSKREITNRQRLVVLKALQSKITDFRTFKFDQILMLLSLFGENMRLDVLIVQLTSMFADCDSERHQLLELIRQICANSWT